MPVLFAEGPYEDESGYGGYTGTPNTLRRQEYWSLTSGALAGHMWGSYWIDRFDPAWQSHLNSQGTIELGYFKSFITALHWYTSCSRPDALAYYCGIRNLHQHGNSREQ